jgi:hypothetical protein
MISWHRRREPRRDGAQEDSGAGVDGRFLSRACASVEPQADAPEVPTDGGVADVRETNACHPGMEGQMHQGGARCGETRLMHHSVMHPGGTSLACGRSCRPAGQWARGRPSLVVLVALLFVPAVVWAQAMRWPEAVAALAAERTRAETCGRLLKRHAGHDAAALSRGELAYAEAKADVDAVIAGLTIVLAQRGTPPQLPDLETRLTRGVQAREAFCRQVTALVPEDPGTRELLVPLLGAVLPPLLEAARTLFTFEKEQDRLLRQTIQTQLEATIWTPFADLTP